MPTWNELFTDEAHRERVPAGEVHRAILLMERTFAARPLRIWDLGCGAGRHSLLIASLGHRVYASDVSPNAVDLTKNWLADANLDGQAAVSNMTDSPFDGETFHGVICWHTIHHNTLANIRRTVDEAHRRLLPGGLFLVNAKSTKSDRYGHGREIERNTFVEEGDGDADVPHHHFDEDGIRDLFPLGQWEFVSLVERIMRYVRRGEAFLERNPFEYTKWEACLKKREPASGTAGARR